MCSGLSVSLFSWESGGLRFGFSSRRNLTAVDNPLAVLHLKNRLYFGTKKMHEGHGMKPPKKGKSRLFLKVQYLYNARIFPISVLHQPFLYFRTFALEVSFQLWRTLKMQFWCLVQSKWIILLLDSDPSWIKVFCLSFKPWLE